MKTPLWNTLPPTQTAGAELDSPELEYFAPYGTRFSSCAVLIFPGGGYSGLSEHEGAGFAGMFRLWGMHAFVCHYRLGSRGHRHPAMLEDAARALRIVRSRAAELGFDPQRILVIGSSAGGHLAATLLTKWDNGDPTAVDPVERLSSRPDLGMLCYPVITMGEHAHAGSRNLLLGPDASPELLEALSAERHVNAQTPPTFIWHTVDDAGVLVENSLLFASALRRAGVSFEMHLYRSGRHGLGMKDGQTWMDDARRWVEANWSV